MRMLKLFNLATTPATAWPPGLGYCPATTLHPLRYQPGNHLAIWVRPPLVLRPAATPAAMVVARWWLGAVVA